jgi:uncharacterized membrane protein YagU involved in acid resistance
MEREPSNIIILFAFAFLVIGASLAGLLVSAEGGDYDGCGMKSLYLMRFSTLIALGFAFRRIANTYPKLKLWFTDTFWGVSAMLFVAGFVLVLLPTSYMLLPLAGGLHFSIALVFGLIASAVGFYLVARENS